MDFRWDNRYSATPARSAGSLGLDATSPHATGGRAGVRPDPGADGAANAGHARRQNRLSRIEGAFSTLTTSRARFLEALPPKDIGGRPSERLRRLRGAWYEHRGYLEILLSLVGDYLLGEHDPADRKATLRLEELLYLRPAQTGDLSRGSRSRSDGRPLLALRFIADHEEAMAEVSRRRTGEGLREALVLGMESLFLIVPENGSEARRLTDRLLRRREESDSWMQLLLDDREELLDRTRTARYRAAEAAAEEAPPVAPRPTKPIAKSWIEIQVVQAATGTPVPSVRLKVTAPNGDQAIHTTGPSGVVRLDDIDPGTCEVACDLVKPKRETTLNFVRTGEVRNGSPAAGGASAGAPVTGGLVIAQVESHKVVAGESIDSLARGAGMTWQDLSVFNWNTCVPEEINVHLVKDVGCTKKTLDGKNYMFDDSDSPGIMYIPHPFEETGLSTGQRHVLQVGSDSRFVLRLENEAGLAIPEAQYEVTFSDRSTRSGSLDRNGMAVIADPVPGDVAVLYPDHDDIVAKSTAVTIRKAFADRDVPMVLWCLKQSPEVMKKAEAAYAKYCDDLSGQGLVEDVYQEVTEPPALQMAVGLMALAGMKVKEDVAVGEG